MYEAILVPTDGSAGTGRVVDHALDLASTYGAALHVLHVIELRSPATGAVPDSVREELRDRGERVVQRVLNRADDADVESTGTVTEGEPHEEILAYAEENGIDLVVMGTHGRSGVGRVLLGSVTERVIRLSEVPVMTVGLPEDGRAVTTADVAERIARRAIEAEGLDLDAIPDVYRETGSWIVRAETVDGSRLNVHVDASTGEARVAELGGG